MRCENFVKSAERFPFSIGTKANFGYHWRTMKRTKIFFIFLIIAALLVSCGGSEERDTSSSSAAGGVNSGEKRTTVRMAVAVDPDGLDPHMSASASTFQVTSSIYETLVSVDESGNIIPSLAEDWQVSPDGLTLTFDIRDGAVFSNGNICDATAAAASFNRLISPESYRSGDYSEIESVRALDEDTLEIKFSSLNTSALSLFAYPWSAVVDVSSADSLRTAPVGSGPFMLESWIPQQKLTLVRNPHYSGGNHIERVEFVFMPDMTSQVTALQGGSVDIIQITGDLVGQFENNDAYRILALPVNGIQLMAMNTASDGLDDIRVRQAVNYAVDKESLIDSVWYGYGEEIGSHFPVVLSEYKDENGRYPYDPDKARQLLIEAGYEDGLTLDMYLPKNYQEYVNAGLVIANQLEAAGINVNVSIVEWATWLSDIYTGRNYDLTVVGHTGRLDAYSLLSRYRSTAAENYFNYDNPEFDSLLDEYTACVDEEERKEIAFRMQDILSEDVPALYIQDPIQIYVTRGDLAGFTIFPINIFKFNEVQFI